MTRQVVFSPEARADILRLYRYIAGQSGAVRAIACVQRIEAFCLGLSSFPERGTKRDDLHPGLRVTGFERRVAIAFTIAPDAVTILRLLYGGRDLGTAFADRPEF